VTIHELINDILITDILSEQYTVSTAQFTNGQLQQSKHSSHYYLTNSLHLTSSYQLKHLLLEIVILL